MKKKMIAGAVAGILICGGLVSASGVDIKTLNFVAPAVKSRLSVLTPREGEIVYERSESNAGFWGFIGEDWISLGGASDVVPAGSISAYVGDVAPIGYRIADGSVLIRSECPALFDVIGTKFGTAGDSDENTVNLPDLRGRFLRGDATGITSRDPGYSERVVSAPGGEDRGIGSLQSESVKKHSHLSPLTNEGNPSGTTKPSPGTVGSTGWVGLDYNLNNSVVSESVENVWETSDYGGTETRPVNVSVSFIIKCH